MLAPAPFRPERREPAWSLARVERPELGWYRELYARVGGPYLWAWRLTESDEAVEAVLHDPAIETYVFRDGSAEEGLLELNLRHEGECEIVYFGVTLAYVGSGAARFMMNRAHDIVWSRPIRRFWLHTCTLDHPRAVPFYLRSGFRPFKREIEIFDDPRALGKLPRDAAPDVPLFT
jgi:GNAT superfamily N-acetyltransferase